MKNHNKSLPGRGFLPILGLLLALAGVEGAAENTRSEQISAAEALVARNPRDAQALMRLIRLYQAEREYGKSTPLLEEVIIIAPRDLEAQRFLGINRFHSGKLREALDSLRAAIDGNPKDYEASFYLGLCYLALDRDDEANKAFDRVASEAQLNVDELYWMVKGYSRVSSAMLSRLAGLGEDSYRMHQIRGEYFDLNNEADHAIKEYEKAVSLKPDVASIQYALGSAYWKRSRVNEAAEAFRRAIELDPRHYMAHHKLGMVLLELNDPAKALTEFRAALNEQPALTNAYLGLGKALYQQGEYTAAVPIIQRYITLAPEDPTPHYLLSQVFRHLNQPTQAAEQVAIFKQKEAEAKAKEPASP